MTRIAIIVIGAVFSATLVACSKGPSGTTGGQITLNGAGSTFVYPMMSKWAEQYSTLKKDARVNYQSIGSGGGIRQISEGTVDFRRYRWANDRPAVSQLETRAHSTYPSGNGRWCCRI
jgi:ABC-type phosphate transport system substrate-binding protein